MGIYLSQPSTDITYDEGSGSKVKYVVGEMQGWRKSMEDSHIALTDMSHNQLKSLLAEAAASGAEDPSVSLFGVFDGHGGKEVAKFVKLKYPQLVIEQLVLNGGDVAAALRESFHKIDELLEDLEHAALLRDLRVLPNPCDTPSGGRANVGNNRPSQMATGPLEDSDSDDETEVMTHFSGRKEPSTTSSTSTTTTTSTTSNTSTDQLTSGGVAAVNENGEKVLSKNEAMQMIRDMLSRAESATTQRSLTASAATADTNSSSNSSGNSSIGNSSGSGDNTNTTTSTATAATEIVVPPQSELQRNMDELETSIATLLRNGLSLGDAKSSTPAEGAKVNSPLSGAEDSVFESNSTSQRTRTLPTGLTVTVHPTDEPSAALSGVLPTITPSPSEIDFTPKAPTPTEEENDLFTPGAPILPPKPEQMGKKAIGDGNGVVPASRETPGGGVTCNLRQHRIMAGCTAVVALHLGNQLFVANAGDSRGVLCRKDGQAYALSYDHKPQQDRELNRITSAGGFVNNVGRINGNLNLSRSLGDLKYKQLTHLAREDQIITAEPDITLTTLEPDDRFFILACDGVWDCLSNQEACDFVTVRLDEGKDARTITNELLNFCLAEDTGKSQGIGCDNMTFLLVLLK